MNAVVMPNPLTREDTAAIEQMLRDADVFVVAPSNISDIYSLEGYLWNALADSTTIYGLLDNNILTRAVAFAAGGRVTENSADVDRLAAAAMCFMIAASFRVEPNISLYEKAARRDHAHAVEQLRLLRIADHINPQAYCDIALGREDQLSREVIAAAEARLPDGLGSKQADFASELLAWQSAYYLLMKVVALDRGDLRPIDKAKAFLTWLRTDAFFSASATMFALIYLSPRRPGQMIKRVNAQDPDIVKEGLRNAAWDLMYLKHWIRNVSESGPETIWFICSNDRLLKQLGRSLLRSSGPGIAEVRFQLLEEFWQGDTAELLRHYDQEEQALRVPGRQVEVERRYALVPDALGEMERDLGL